MTIYHVMQDFKEVLEAAVKEAHLKTKLNVIKDPQIVLGYLDPLQEEDKGQEDFPYIIVRYINDMTLEEQSNLSLKLIFGAYSEDIEGWVDVLHLMELVKKAVLTKPVFNFYTIDRPIKTSMPEEQPYPYFFGFMELTLTIPQLQMEGEQGRWQVE